MMDTGKVHAAGFKESHLQEPHVLFDLDHLVHHDIAVRERGGRPSSASPIIPHDLCLHLKEKLERSRKGVGASPTRLIQGSLDLPSAPAFLPSTTEPLMRDFEISSVDGTET
jgi:hypothetical protein